ncbi:transposase [Fibrella sp. ES10-3-2-2]
MAIHAMPDHIQLFIGFGPTLTIANLVRDVKANSTRFIKDKGWAEQFAWQEGYGAFSYSQSQVKDVIQYVLNQEQHHLKRTFRQEYVLLLQRFEVAYDPECIFEFYDEQVTSNVSLLPGH